MLPFGDDEAILQPDSHAIQALGIGFAPTVPGNINARLQTEHVSSLNHLPADVPWNEVRSFVSFQPYTMTQAVCEKGKVCCWGGG